MIIKRHIKYCISTIAILLLFNSCFTGVESTKKITEKDVIKSGITIGNENKSELDTLCAEKFVNWKKGKRFYISDNQISIVLKNANKSIENKNLKGDTIFYDNYYEENILGTSKTVILSFKDRQGNKYTYNTNKTINEINNSQFNVQFLIDLSIVEKAKGLIKDTYLYINTSNWYDDNDNIINGMKYVKVKVCDVKPGNMIYSLKVMFEYNSKYSNIFVSVKDNPVQNRAFSYMFSAQNPRDKYPTIKDENWELIINSNFALGMTKDECRLALGAPQNIDKAPSNQGLKERWLFGNGVYMIFEDGLLVKYRK